MARLHHLALGARDVRLLGDFYSGIFELPVLATHLAEDASLRSLWLALDPGVLMIERTAEVSRYVEGVGAGLFLLSFHVSLEERGKLEGRLSRLGSPIEERSEFTSYARDPEGNRIAISSYVLPSSPM